jgi:hypothetical protein
VLRRCGERFVFQNGAGRKLAWEDFRRRMRDDLCGDTG